MVRKNLKKAMELCFICFLFFLVSTATGCKKADIFEYRFERGSDLREHYREGVKIVFPKLILFKGDKKKCKIEFTFPLGAYLWKDKSEQGYLLFKFMEKRFATVGTYGIDVIDLRYGLRIPVVREPLWEIETQRDDTVTFIISIFQLPFNCTKGFFSYSLQIEFPNLQAPIII